MFGKTVAIVVHTMCEYEEIGSILVIFVPERNPRNTNVVCQLDCVCQCTLYSKALLKGSKWFSRRESLALSFGAKELVVLVRFTIWLKRVNVVFTVTSNY